jgi:hypothetical protein
MACSHPHPRTEHSRITDVLTDYNTTSWVPHAGTASNAVHMQYVYDVHMPTYFQVLCNWLLHILGHALLTPYYAWAGRCQFADIQQPNPIQLNKCYAALPCIVETHTHGCGLGSLPPNKDESRSTNLGCPHTQNHN